MLFDQIIVPLRDYRLARPRYLARLHSNRFTLNVCTVQGHMVVTLKESLEIAAS